MAAPSDDLNSEFQTLGRNLRDALRAAWESEERRTLQQEVENGLAAAAAALAEAGRETAHSETGQRLQSDLHDLNARLQNGQLATRLRADLLAALRTLNAEIEKAARPDEPPAEGQTPGEKDE